MIVHGYAGNAGAIESSNKYRAKRTEADGIIFGSKKEAKRYTSLKILEKGGYVRNLELQPKYELVVNGVKIGRYTADFRYEEFLDMKWQLIVEDVKGYSRHARDYPLRVKLMKAIHGIQVRET